MDDANELHKAAYTRHLTAVHRSEKTIKGYCWWIDDLALWMDGQDVTTATKPDMEDYFGNLLRELADTSAAVGFRSLRAFFNWCVREEIIERSPMAGMSEPATEDRPPDLATDDELKALIKTCTGRGFEQRRDLAIVRLFLEPGTPRRAEMAGLLVDKLDMRYSKLSFLGKGARWRTIPFGVKTGQALDRYLRERAKHPLAGLPELWLGQRGMALTEWGIRQLLVRRCRQAGIRLLKPHQLRHTSYHHFREAGGGEDDAEVLFGWTPGSRMSRVYGRSARESRAERAARKMSVADRL